MDKLFWIEYTQVSADAMDSFIGDMQLRAQRARNACVDLLGSDDKAAMMKKGEAMAYDTLRRAVEHKLKEEIEYNDYRERTGQG